MHFLQGFHFSFMLFHLLKGNILVSECDWLLTVAHCAIPWQIIMENINYNFADGSSKHGSEEDLCKMERPTPVHSSNQTKYRGTVDPRQVNILTKHFYAVSSRFTVAGVALHTRWSLNRSSKRVIMIWQKSCKAFLNVVWLSCDVRVLLEP